MAKPTQMGVKPELLQWTLDRSRKTAGGLAYGPTRSIRAWLAGKTKPTMRQLQAFAKRTYVPFGYLLLAEPPPKTHCHGPARPPVRLADRL